MNRLVSTAGPGGGWLRDHVLATAIALSVLWHLFWFFSITIVVSPGRGKSGFRPRIVALGPVLDDAIFRTLVENKLQLSETFYRQLSDFSAAVDVPPQTLERHSPGGVVSIPAGKGFLRSLRSLIGGTKTSPEYDFGGRFKTPFEDESYSMKGEVKSRRVMTRPEEPTLPSAFGVPVEYADLVIEFVVNPVGVVTEAHVAVSSGRAEVDTLWIEYLRLWQFSPLDPGKRSLDQRGRVKFYLSRSSGNEHDPR